MRFSFSGKSSLFQNVKIEIFFCGVFVIFVEFFVFLWNCCFVFLIFLLICLFIYLFFFCLFIYLVFVCFDYYHFVIFLCFCFFILFRNLDFPYGLCTKHVLGEKYIFLVFYISDIIFEGKCCKLQILFGEPCNMLEIFFLRNAIFCELKPMVESD